MPLVAAAVARVDGTPGWPALQPMELDALQAAYRRAFGATGFLCYETEYGLPHEFRQAQELAEGVNNLSTPFIPSLNSNSPAAPDRPLCVIADNSRLHFHAFQRLDRTMTVCYITVTWERSQNFSE